MPALIFLAVLIVVSLITFLLYGVDKYKAKRKKWRIPEKVLLGCSLCCGAIGGLAAMSLFRHKTKHNHFWVANIIGLTWQLALLVVLFI